MRGVIVPPPGSLSRGVAPPPGSLSRGVVPPSCGESFPPRPHLATLSRGVVSKPTLKRSCFHTPFPPPRGELFPPLPLPYPQLAGSPPPPPGPILAGSLPPSITPLSQKVVTPPTGPPLAGSRFHPSRGSRPPLTGSFFLLQPPHGGSVPTHTPLALSHGEPFPPPLFRPPLMESRSSYTHPFPPLSQGAVSTYPLPSCREPFPPNP